MLSILALFGLANGLLGWWGSYLGISDRSLSVQLIVGDLFYPVAFVLGVERGDDLLLVARLIGVKIAANEFVAVSVAPRTQDSTLAKLGHVYQVREPHQAPRVCSAVSAIAGLITTYAICGLAIPAREGFRSVFSRSLLRLGQAGAVAEVAMSALISGIVATLTSLSIAGMWVNNAV